MVGFRYFTARKKWRGRAKLTRIFVSGSPGWFKNVDESSSANFRDTHRLQKTSRHVFHNRANFNVHKCYLSLARLSLFQLGGNQDEIHHCGEFYFPSLQPGKNHLDKLGLVLLFISIGRVRFCSLAIDGQRKKRKRGQEW